MYQYSQVVEVRFTPASKAVLRHAVVWDVKCHKGKRRIFKSDHSSFTMMLPRKPVCRKNKKGEGRRRVDIRLDIELEEGGDVSHEVEVTLEFCYNYGVFYNQKRSGAIDNMRVRNKTALINVDYSMV